MFNPYWSLLFLDAKAGLSCTIWSLAQDLTSPDQTHMRIWKIWGTGTARTHTYELSQYPSSGLRPLQSSQQVSQDCTLPIAKKTTEGFNTAFPPPSALENNCEAARREASAG